MCGRLRRGPRGDGVLEAARVRRLGLVGSPDQTGLLRLAVRPPPPPPSIYLSICISINLLPPHSAPHPPPPHGRDEALRVRQASHKD
eukprot:1194988-Prorocentrum_minimum.AAC.1